MLNNNSEFKYFDWANRIYTSNTPLNEEMANTAIIGDNATLLNIAAEYRPILRYRIYNGRKRVDASNSPIIRASFNAGLPNILNSGVDFQRIELGYEDKIEVGVRGQLSFAFKAGTFLNATKLDFPDYKHFAGNLIVLQYGDPLTTFRMLDYTRFSTKTNFVEGHALYNFRKFLLTRIPILRVSSIREHVFVNYVGVNGLKTNYIEAGYGIQGILKILRIEGVVNFLDGKYQSVGMRIGLSTKLRVQKSDD